MSRISSRLARANFTTSGQADRGSAGTADLFAYGTLLIDDVITALIGRVPSWTGSTAPGWRAASIPDQDYPGLIPNVNTSAAGRIYRDLTPTEWVLLDHFEDSQYHLDRILVEPDDVPVLTYTWDGPRLEATWRASEFGGVTLGQYVERCETWRIRYQRAVGP